MLLRKWDCATEFGMETALIAVGSTLATLAALAFIRFWLEGTYPYEEEECL